MSSFLFEGVDYNVKEAFGQTLCYTVFPLRTFAPFAVQGFECKIFDSGCAGLGKMDEKLEHRFPSVPW